MESESTRPRKGMQRLEWSQGQPRLSYRRDSLDERGDGFKGPAHAFVSGIVFNLEESSGVPPVAPFPGPIANVWSEPLPEQIFGLMRFWRKTGEVLLDHRHLLWVGD